MTDREKLDKLVAEIERRKKLHEKSLINPIHEGFGLQNVIKAKISELTYLHSFIDSMQEEYNITGIKSKEATGKLKECIDNVSEEGLEKARKQLEELTKECMYSKDNYTDEDRKALCEDCKEKCAYAIAGVISTNAQVNEESVNNGLDLGCGVIWKYEDRVSEEQVKESLISKHEDKTCKENGKSLTQEPISDDLEQAIDTYLATYFGGEKEKQDWPFLKKMAIHFAEWQKKKDNYAIEIAHIAGEEEGKNIMKQQMMTKAVKVKISNASMVSLPSDCGLKVGDKVLIIKED